jgi:hypothetical protein
MTTADVFWGVLLALAVFDLTKDLVEYVLYKIQSKKRAKKLDEILASLHIEVEPVRKPVKRAAVKTTKSRTVKKAVAKKRK